MEIHIPALAIWRLAALPELLGFPFARGCSVQIDNGFWALTHRSNRFVVWLVVRVAIQVVADAAEIKVETSICLEHSSRFVRSHYSDIFSRVMALQNRRQAWAWGASPPTAIHSASARVRSNPTSVLRSNSDLKVTHSNRTLRLTSTSPLATRRKG